METAEKDEYGVSIHAPARGATLILLRGIALQDGFNPRPRAGGDLILLRGIALQDGFQSTPPRGGRRVRAYPRAKLVDVSIHAPARGATFERLD